MCLSEDVSLQLLAVAAALGLRASSSRKDTDQRSLEMVEVFTFSNLEKILLVPN